MAVKKKEQVKHPDHYAAGREYEPYKVIFDWGLDFNLGNVVKYISRAGRKDPNKLLEDLQKARQYLDYEIECVEKDIHRRKRKARKAKSKKENKS